MNIISCRHNVHGLLDRITCDKETTDFLVETLAQDVRIKGDDGQEYTITGLWYSFETLGVEFTVRPVLNG